MTALRPAAKKPPTKKSTSTVKTQTAEKKPATKKPATKKPATSSSAASLPAGRITPEAMAFIKELATRQDRAWFEPRKQELKRLLHDPLLAVLADAGASLMETFPAVEDAAPRVFRIHRDVRFSKDKSPYKDHAGGTLAIGQAQIYVHVDGDDVWAAVGVYDPTPGQLVAFRAAVGSTAMGPALLAESERLEARGYTLMSIDSLARAPAGWSPTHPCIRLLRMKGWALKLPAIPRRARDDGTLGAVIAGHVKAAKAGIAVCEQAFAHRTG
jgi:uncharacterized protein (TIGR02453 family)